MLVSGPEELQKFYLLISLADVVELTVYFACEYVSKNMKDNYINNLQKTKHCASEVPAKSS